MGAGCSNLLPAAVALRRRTTRRRFRKVKGCHFGVQNVGGASKKEYKDTLSPVNAAAVAAAAVHSGKRCYTANLTTTSGGGEDQLSQSSRTDENSSSSTPTLDNFSLVTKKDSLLLSSRKDEVEEDPLSDGKVAMSSTSSSSTAAKNLMLEGNYHNSPHCQYEYEYEEESSFNEDSIRTPPSMMAMATITRAISFDYEEITINTSFDGSGSSAEEDDQDMLQQSSIYEEVTIQDTCSYDVITVEDDDDDENVADLLLGGGSLQEEYLLEQRKEYSEEDMSNSMLFDLSGIPGLLSHSSSPKYTRTKRPLTATAVSPEEQDAVTRAKARRALTPTGGGGGLHRVVTSTPPRHTGGGGFQIPWLSQQRSVNSADSNSPPVDVAAAAAADMDEELEQESVVQYSVYEDVTIGDTCSYDVITIDDDCSYDFDEETMEDDDDDDDDDMDQLSVTSSSSMTVLSEASDLSPRAETPTGGASNQNDNGKGGKWKARLTRAKLRRTSLTIESTTSPAGPAAGGEKETIAPAVQAQYGGEETSSLTRSACDPVTTTTTGEPALLFDGHQVTACTLPTLPGTEIVESKPMVWSSVSKSFNEKQQVDMDKEIGTMMQQAQAKLVQQTIYVGCNVILGVTTNVATDSSGDNTGRAKLVIVTLCGTPCKVVPTAKVPSISVEAIAV
jgi:hypothetical protein